MNEKFLLEEEMGIVQDWFARLYGNRGHKLKIYTKHNLEKRREEYILDLFFNTTSRSCAFQVPFDALELIDMRVRIKERWVPWAQKQIMATIG